MSFLSHTRAAICATLLFATAPAFSQVVSDSVAVADSLLALELESELATTNPQSVTQRTSPLNLNPAISVIGDFRAWYDSGSDRSVDGELHEVETSFKAAIDPYARADFYVATGHNGEGEFEFEMEEAYLTTLALPYRLQARAGKFRSSFGKLNRIHPHALPFIDTPAIYANYLGDEGLNDQGVGLSWLLPNDSFYQDLTVEITRGPGESESFVRDEESSRLLYVARLKNFWDLSESATLELGFSGATGPSEDGGTTMLGGADATYIWKPLQFNTYRSIMLQAEAFVSNPSVAGIPATWGFFGLGSYQLSRKWFAIGRIDHSDRPGDTSWNETVVSGTLGWHATEFQKLEFGIRSQTADEIDRNTQLLFRAIFVIGAHGAHEY